MPRGGDAVTLRSAALLAVASLSFTFAPARPHGLPAGIDLPRGAACALPTADGAADPSCRAPETAGTAPGPLPCVTIDGVAGAAPAQFPSDVALAPDATTVYVAMEEQDGLDDVGLAAYDA